MDEPEETSESYFAQIDQSDFDVVDECYDDDEEVQLNIKTERPDSKDSNHSKESSTRSSTNDRSKDSKSNRERDKKGTSQDRTNDRRSSLDRARDRRNVNIRRSPPRRRFSPPKPPRRRLSPIRRVSPFRRANSPRANSPIRNRVPTAEQRRQALAPNTAFLEDLQKQLLQEGHGVDDAIEQLLHRPMRIDLNAVKEKPDLQMNYPMQQSNVMPMFNPMMNQMPQTAGQNMMLNPFAMQVPMGYGMYGNAIPPSQMAIQMPIPQPVPPPQVEVNYEALMGNSSSSLSPPVINHFNGNVMSKPSVKETSVERPPVKKTPNQESQNLTDLLRQKSKKKPVAKDELTAKNAKALEICKEAVDFLSNMEANKSKYPVTCFLSDKNVPQPKELANRSPLLSNQNNPTFLFQAVNENCHAVFEHHPLRNIYGPISEMAQYLKFDLHELSKTVSNELALSQLTKNNQQLPVPEPPSISKPVIKMTTTREVQTEALTCWNCNQRDMIKQSAISRTTQTTIVTHADAGTQNSDFESEGGFRVYIDAQTMNNRNFEQHHALEVFSKAFDIECPFVSKTSNSERILDRRISDVIDDRMIYVNPDNPNPDQAIGAVASPRDEFFFTTSPIRQNEMDHPRPQQSIFDKLGDKVSDHSDSPHDYGLNFKEEAAFHPYKIQSPKLYAVDDIVRPRSPDNFRRTSQFRDRSPEHFRDRSSEHFRKNSHRGRSPGPSNRYRNRSRSVSPRRHRSRENIDRSRSHSRSPKRFRGGYKLTERRGRY